MVVVVVVVIGGGGGVVSGCCGSGRSCYIYSGSGSSESGNA